MTQSIDETVDSLAIRWHNNRLSLLDQRALPHASDWIVYDDAASVSQAIRDMVVRGAPAIGITAAYGLALEAIKLGHTASAASLRSALDVLATSRPTAVNLFWALARMEKIIGAQQGEQLVTALTREAREIHREDRRMNEKMAAFGATLLTQNGSVYTHCNTGALATGGHGTALGIIRTAWSNGQIDGVYAGETRPWLQGARLTSWELMQDNIPVTLVVDSAAGHLMQQGKISAVIVGSDRISANGDTVNKIGTYNLAVLAQHHGIPFIVAAPISTIDSTLASGDLIEIEQRNGNEISRLGSQSVAPNNVNAYNPAFDMTPAALISAIVTERGVIAEPNAVKMTAHLRA